MLMVLIPIFVAVVILFRFYVTYVQMWKKELVSTLLISVAFCHLLVPFLVSLLLFNQTEYRNWILEGPTPFNRLGSGPYLLWVVGGIVFIGYIYMALGLWIRFKRE